MAIPSAGGKQETTVLHMVDFFLWLASISPSKVAEDYRERVILYRRECKQVLWLHFMQRQWQMEEEVTRLRGFALAFNPLWGKIAAMQQARVEREMIYRHLRRPFFEVLAVIEEMEVSGAIARADWHYADKPSVARVASSNDRRGPPFPRDRIRRDEDEQLELMETDHV